MRAAINFTSQGQNSRSNVKVKCHKNLIISEFTTTHTPFIFSLLGLLKEPSLRHNGPRVWNSLSFDIRSENSYKLFSHKLKMSLIASYI